MRLSCLLLLALGGLALGQSKDEAFKKAEAIKKGAPDKSRFLVKAG